MYLKLVLIEFRKNNKFQLFDFSEKKKKRECESIRKLKIHIYEMKETVNAHKERNHINKQ